MGFSGSRGLINDSISDMLTRIRNAILAQKSNVNVPYTKLTLELVKILEKEGFIQGFYIELLDSNRSAGQSSQGSSNSGSSDKTENNVFLGSEAPANNHHEVIIRLKYSSKKLYKGKTKESCITNLRRISKPGLRIYANYREIPRILNGTGIAIISTPSGVMTDREARAKKLGGELLCSVW